MRIEPQRVAPFALAVAAGLALPLSLAPFDWPLFDLVSVALLFALVREANAARAAWLGWCFGLGKYGLGASWVYVSIHDYGHATPLLAGALVALFVALLALFPALMTSAYAVLAGPRTKSRALTGGHILSQGLAFSACWVRVVAGWATVATAFFHYE